MIKIVMLLLILLILILLVINKINKLISPKRVPKLFTAIVFLSMTTFLLLSLRLLNDSESRGTYTPAKYDGKDLIPGKVELEK